MLPAVILKREETPLEAAIRENQRRGRLESWNLRFAGELHFHFLDGLKLKGTVYTGRDFKRGAH